MNIEDEIFKDAKIDFNKINNYGFKKDNNLYKYSKTILNDTFRIDIIINKDGKVQGKIYDLACEEEYTNFRVKDNIGSFTSNLRDEFQKLLLDIKDKCFKEDTYIFAQANRIVTLIKEKYHDKPEFLWEKFPKYAVFRNKKNQKWYSLIMNIDKNKLDKKLKGEIEIINIKLKPEEINNLLKQKGFYEAYHMNKKYWISIMLDDTLKDELIMSLIAKSYAFTNI